ncbi:MAG: LytTR family DNA-binding domain-containing protein [Crocinitomicaceae bacterium]|nr:LytTR family DNA-binding domain-containing protein [Crocinitomicaceae bacterium]
MIELKALVLDDEKDSGRIIFDLLQDNFTNVSLTTYHDFNTSAQYIDRLKPDILFLDIRFPEGVGFEIVEKCQYKNFQLVMVTAYSEFALEAFEFKALGYITKPINPLKFIKVVSSVIDIIRIQKFKEHLSGKTLETFEISIKGSKHLLDVDKIIYAKSEGNYTNIYTTYGSFLIAKTLKTVIESLDYSNFIRCHQSYYLNVTFSINYNKKIQEIELLNGQFIPVSRRYKDKIADFFLLKDKFLSE